MKIGSKTLICRAINKQQKPEKKTELLTMKKLALTTVVLAVGTVLGFSQGAIILNSASGVVSTNNGSGGVGLAGGASATWYYNVLDMTASTWSGLTAQQQANALGISALNTAGISLWTDSGVSAANSSLHAGGINGLSGGATAANWAQPPANGSYSDASSYDYFVIVGWSSVLGTSWSSVSAALLNGTVPQFSPTTWAWFGESPVAYNYAGVLGGSPPAVSVFSPSTTTGLAGSGGLAGLTLSPVVVPEPTTLAVAGLGGLAMLLIRRRK
jgi:hypothetical protein